MVRIPTRYLRPRMGNASPNTTAWFEPHALHLDSNGDGWFDPQAFGTSDLLDPRFDFSLYLKVTRTPAGVLVELPVYGLWKPEPQLDTSTLLPVLAFSERTP